MADSMLRRADLREPQAKRLRTADASATGGSSGSDGGGSKLTTEQLALIQRNKPKAKLRRAAAMTAHVQRGEAAARQAAGMDGLVQAPSLKMQVPYPPPPPTHRTHNAIDFRNTRDADICHGTASLAEFVQR